MMAVSLDGCHSKRNEEAVSSRPPEFGACV